MEKIGSQKSFSPFSTWQSVFVKWEACKFHWLFLFQIELLRIMMTNMRARVKYHRTNQPSSEIWLTSIDSKLLVLVFSPSRKLVFQPKPWVSHSFWVKTATIFDELGVTGIFTSFCWWCIYFFLLLSFEVWKLNKKAIQNHDTALVALVVVTVWTKHDAIIYMLSKYLYSVIFFFLGKFCTRKEIITVIFWAKFHLVPQLDNQF